MSEKKVAAGVTEAPAVEVQQEEPAKVEQRFFTSTLAERGPVLPIGVLTPSNTIARDLARRAWKTKDERELGRLKKPKMSMAVYVGTVVAYMYSRLGAHSWTPETPVNERLLKVNQMYMGDVFYAYLWLRREVIGNTLGMQVTCASCKKDFGFEGDLGSVEIRCVNDLNALDWTYPLKFPITIRKKEVSLLRLRSPKWGALNLGENEVLNEATAKISAIRSSIVGLGEDPTEVSLSDNEMDELDKADLEGIAAVMNQETPGPKMVIDGECPRCDQPFKRMIDWGYDSFFTNSSV